MNCNWCKPNMTAVEHFPEGSVHIGVLKSEGEPRRSYWAIQAESNVRIVSVNLEGNDTRLVVEVPR